MTHPWDQIIKTARDCHTKIAWESFFTQFGDQIATSSHSKPLVDIFRALKADPQSPHYDPIIWNKLIHGCLSAWNLELGREIAEFVKKIPVAAINIPSAHVYLESGQPSIAREIAQKTSRLSNLQHTEKLQLEILIANSYAEEGKRQKAIRQLAKVKTAMDQSVVTTKERADFFTHMARMHFFLGRYHESAELFYESSKIYLSLNDWEAAAKGIFNTAACHLNGSSRKRDDAFAMIEECRKLAISHDLPGPLSHCEAAYGLDSLQHGDFPAAREHLRLALDYLPISDKSYRRLHILSMLSYTYLSMGRYHLAKKFGQQTLDLAALDESERNKTRYFTLKAELLWEDGHILESLDILQKIIKSFDINGVHTLEDLSTLNRYMYQSTCLNTNITLPKTQFSDSIKNHSTWLSFLHATGMQLIIQKRYLEADRIFNETLQKSRLINHRYHEAIALQGLIISRMTRRKIDELNCYDREFEVAVARLGETPLKVSVLFIDAAKAYQRGDFAECTRILKNATKSSRQCFSDRFVLDAWIATIEGRSFRFSYPWQGQLVAHLTKSYFAPSIEVIDERSFKVSEHYIVNLEKHPSLADLLRYLMLKPTHIADATEIQVKVWQQSINAQGWQQKIRNTIMRLRDFFPFTMAPLIIHSDRISLNREAIEIFPPQFGYQDSQKELLRLLEDCPMSSLQAAERLAVSPATAKRLLKKLTEQDAVSMIKSGRNVIYGMKTRLEPEL
jgi:tetratricopeptide (TPR) repeat protein